MSLKALERYPLSIGSAGRKIQIRPLQRGDEQELARFFQRLSAEERAVLKDDVTNSAVIAAWCSNIDPERILPLVATDGNRIVADATLHRSRTGWTRHVATMRITVDFDYRRKGLGRSLIRELVDLAEQLKLVVLDAEVMADQKSAIGLFLGLGFRPIATLPLHVSDANGRLHDLLVLSKTIMAAENYGPPL